MDRRLQRRIQRYGWDRAAAVYDDGWQTQLGPAHDLMLDLASLRSGERVLDVACGTGLVSFRATAAVGSGGAVVGTDISGEMVGIAEHAAAICGTTNVHFQRCDAEALDFADRSFDAAICGLGLMYVPDPVAALREMHRVLRPGGRATAAVWGARQACGWAEIFPITDARVASDVCPMFFHLGTRDVMALAFAQAGFADVEVRRLRTMLRYPSAEAVLAALFRGGPVALAYGRFDAATRCSVHAEYLESIAAYRTGDGYCIPGEFVVAAARVPASHRQHAREKEDACI